MADLVITASQVKAGAGAVEGTGVAGATVTAGQSVYEDQADGKIKLADSNLSLAAAKAKGVALHGALQNQPIRYQKGGKVIVGAAAAPAKGTIYVASALTKGARVSPTLQRLVDRLDASDVLVYLMFDRSPSSGIAGHTSLVTAAAGRRYLRISIDRRNIGCQRIAILGHELQHAVEIADEPSVTDPAGLAALYRRIGFRSANNYTDRFDSQPAIAAGQRIQREVLAHYTEFTSR